MRVNREELFAPMACVIKVADYDEALSVANDTDFGTGFRDYHPVIVYSKPLQKKCREWMRYG